MRSGSQVIHKQVDNHEFVLEVVFEALVFVQNLNFRVKSQDPNFSTFHEKHLSLVWVAAVSLTVQHHASSTLIISMEQKEEDRFLVLGLVFESELQRHSQVPRVAIVPREVHPLAHVL